jgi:hypothetical protein
VGALGGVLLVGIMVLSVGSLTKAPPLYGDETWLTSSVWSLFDGHGYKPYLLSGAGAYDGIPDYWGPRIGIVPNLAGELILPTTLVAARGVSLLTGLVALAVFFVAMRRLLDSELALVATAALAGAWVFFAYSHWLRWDALALVVMCVILLLFVAGPPSLRVAAISGAVIGIGLDFANSIPAVAPGVLLLCAWEPELRWRRIGALGAGVAAGLTLYVLLHFGPGFDFGQARDQFDLVFNPIGGLGEIPLLEAIKHVSLTPILDEGDRYTGMLYAQWQTLLIALVIGLAASIVMLLRTLGVLSSWLGIAGAGVLAVIVSVPVLGSTPHTEIRDAIWVLAIAAVALTLALGTVAIRSARPYPHQAVPAILLVGQILGWSLIVGQKSPLYAGYSIPFIVAAFACALHSLSPAGLRRIATAGGLAAAAIASGVFLASDIRDAPAEPAVDSQLSERAREIVPPGQTVMGEMVYWWLYKDERYRANINIWLQRWQHPAEPFADSFNRLCPDYVLLDDLWLDRYLYTDTTGEEFPNVAPTDPGEKDELMTLLRSEYETADSVDVDDRTITFWRREAPECPNPERAMTSCWGCVMSFRDRASCASLGSRGPVSGTSITTGCSPIRSGADLTNRCSTWAPAARPCFSTWNRSGATSDSICTRPTSSTRGDVTGVRAGSSRKPTCWRGLSSAGEESTW